MVMEKTDSQATGKVFGLAALGLSITSLIAALTRPVHAAQGTPEEPVNVIVDGDVRKALAALLLQGESIGNSLETTNQYLSEIIRVLGGTIPGEAPVGQGRILVPFQEKSQTLTKGTKYPLYSMEKARGALIWAVIDVTDPDTTISFTFDDLLWEFAYTTLYNEGVDRPLFPGVWLSKYDIANSHYAVIFSAGDTEGFLCNKRMAINVCYNGSASATLTEGRGIVWNYV